MSKDINLLPDVTLKEEKESKQQKLLTIVSMAILIIGIVGIIGAFTIDITYTNSFKKISEANVEKGKEILGYADTESYQRAIKSKLGTSTNILKAAKDYKTIVENVQSMLPDAGVTVSDIAIDKSDRININAKAADAPTFKLLERNLLDKTKGGKYFTDVNFGSISTTKDGILQFNIAMSLLKNGGSK